MLSQAAVGQRLREDSLRELLCGRSGLTRDGHVDHEWNMNETNNWRLTAATSAQQDEEPHSERKEREGKNNRGILAQSSLDDIISLCNFPDVTPGWFMLVSASLGLAMSRNTMLVD